MEKFYLTQTKRTFIAQSESKPGVLTEVYGLDELDENVKEAWECYHDGETCEPFYEIKSLSQFERERE